MATGQQLTKEEWNRTYPDLPYWDGALRFTKVDLDMKPIKVECDMTLRKIDVNMTLRKLTDPAPCPGWTPSRRRFKDPELEI